MGHDLAQPRTVRVGVIGRADLSQSERDSLELLGRLLARAGRALVTTDAPGTNAAVAAGYASEGGTPQIVEARLFEMTDLAIVYPDQKLLDRLGDARVLDPTRHTVISSERDLVKFIDIATAKFVTP